ncbi:hypothetical protein DPMN_016095 [Dreissena polymorpha]|uniref:Uncharacterized protein n=1 Tax=Dreissena polymorpha TaxID=45954 RepID=A0A9D4NCP9_DREPO|nr:hypothetical protein DPMN_016095 [Dreissena polymorpha]
MRDDTEQLSKTFVSTIVNRYPDVMSGYPTDDVGEEELGIIYNFLSAAECMWPPGYANASFPNENVTIFNNDDNDDDDGDYYGNQNKTSYNYKDTIDDNGFHSGLNAQHLMVSTRVCTCHTLYSFYST